MIEVRDSLSPSGLPAAPANAVQIMQAFADEQINNQALVKLIESDAFLSAELLNIVNAPFFYRAHKASNISHALEIHGRAELRNVFYCICVRDLLDPNNVSGFDISGFWEDSLRRAAAAQLLAVEIGLDGNTSFSACLLQDLGLPILFHRKRLPRAAWLEFLSLNPEQRFRFELKLFATSHERVSLRLMQDWSLPSPDIEAIEHRYHCQELPADTGAELEKLCQVMDCAEWLASLFSASGKSAILKTVHAKLATQFALTEQQGFKLLDNIPARVEEAAQTLGLPVQKQEDFDLVLHQANARLVEENTGFLELTRQLEQALKERDVLADALTKELELAGEIQRSLLPKEKEARFPLYGVNLPAQELSGDFFDYFKQEDGSVYFCLGDVSGKGITASLLMAKASSLFHCLGKREQDLGKLMDMINTEICETSVRGMFVAMVAGKYYPECGTVQLVNAGNPPVLFIQQNHEIKKIDAGAAPLGIVADAEFTVVEFKLGKGHLLMFSDGVTEGFVGDDSKMGMDGLLDILRDNIDKSPREQLNTVLDRFKQSGTAQRDDIAIMVLEHEGQGVQSLFNYEFSSKPAELQCMRQQLRQILIDQDCKKVCVDLLVLAVNEAAMNIIQHAYNFDCSGKIHLQIQRKENELLFKLTDFACPIDRSCVKSRDLKDIRPGGLGVHFINEIMDEVIFEDDCKQAGNILLLRKNLDAVCLKEEGDKE